MRITIYYFILFATLLMASSGCVCKCRTTNNKSKKISKQTTTTTMQHSPELDKISERPVRGGNLKQVAPAIVYKTRANYDNKVPITLSADKKTIVSYPHPIDLYHNGKLSYPTPLDNGYLLDNRGIGKNVAFTNYTYEAYANLPQAPTMAQLFDSIIDDNPLVELFNLGPRIYFEADEVREINLIIKDNFKDYREIKSIKKTQ